MNFISTHTLTNENAPKGQVLVQYLEPSWGGWSIEFGVAYFDNPNDYEEKKEGRGWKLWHNSNEINVLAYAEFPTKIKSDLEELKQSEFLKKFNSYHPNNGNVGSKEDSNSASLTKAPERVQRKRIKDFRLPANTKCVNRGTKYGNPYKVHKGVGGYYITHKTNKFYHGIFECIEDANETAIKYFRVHCEETFTKEEIQEDLKDKNLACFCSLKVPCHADYLLEIANK